MDLKIILQQVPGVNRRFVYYLESQGYIQPTRLQKERIARRDYSPDDLRVVRETWRYYNRGFSLQAAYTLGVKQQHAVAYVTLEVPVQRREEVLEYLKALPEVVEAGVVYADTADFVVKCSAPQEADIFQALVPLFVQMGVHGVPGLMKISDNFGRHRRPTRKGSKQSMMAYVLMKVPSKNSREVMGVLSTYPEVMEASIVYGESDIVARIEVGNQAEMDDLIMTRIHGMPTVESTRTYLVVGSMYWHREEEGAREEAAREKAPVRARRE